jgi:NmrA-like family
VVIGSFLDPAVYKGFNSVIAAVGNNIMRLQPAMIEAAANAGVTHFVPSEFGADLMQKEIAGRRYFRDKQVTRDHLRMKAKEVKGFQYTLVLTGSSSEWTPTSFWGFDNEKNAVTLYGRPDALVDTTAIADVARYIVGSLLIPFEGSERTIRVRGWQATATELIQALEHARGLKYDVSFHDEKEMALKQEEARLAHDENIELGYSAMPLLASGYSVVNGKGEELDVDKFDFKPETFPETLERLYKK